jgi:hypothetical protein
MTPFLVFAARDIEMDVDISVSGVTQRAAAPMKLFKPQKPKQPFNPSSPSLSTHPNIPPHETHANALEKSAPEASRLAKVYGVRCPKG